MKVLAGSSLAGLLVVVGCASTMPPREARSDPVAAEAAYRAMLGRLSVAGRLDTDPALDARTQRVFARLVRVAADGRSETTAWPWEAHAADDPRVDALCMPGGKLLVGLPFVRALGLDDGEIAMMLAHEMGHLLAGHRHDDAAIDPESSAEQDARQAEIARSQELEADALGMDLVLRAGWPIEDVLGFFDKLAARESPATFSPSHPPARLRFERALSRSRVR